MTAYLYYAIIKTVKNTKQIQIQEENEMSKEVIMVYKNWHTDEKKEIRYFDTFEDAENAAKKMIDQFKYWGGGSVPVFIEEIVWTKSNGCQTLKRVEYSEKLYIRYARENGTAYGYYRVMHKNEKIIRIA